LKVCDERIQPIARISFDNHNQFYDKFVPLLPKKFVPYHLVERIKPENRLFLSWMELLSLFRKVLVSNKPERRESNAVLVRLVPLRPHFAGPSEH
jgi:hypothetical protein